MFNERKPHAVYIVVALAAGCGGATATREQPRLALPGVSPAPSETAPPSTLDVEPLASCDVEKERAQFSSEEQTFVGKNAVMRITPRYDFATLRVPTVPDFDAEIGGRLSGGVGGLFLSLTDLSKRLKAAQRAIDDAEERVDACRDYPNDDDEEEALDPNCDQDEQRSVAEQLAEAQKDRARGRTEVKREAARILKALRAAQDKQPTIAGALALGRAHEVAAQLASGSDLSAPEPIRWRPSAGTRIPGARRAYREAVALAARHKADPLRHHARYLLGAARMRVGCWASARADFREPELAALSDQRALVRYTRAFLALRVGALKEADQLLEAMRENPPDSSNSAALLANEQEVRRLLLSVRLQRGSADAAISTAIELIGASPQEKERDFAAVMLAHAILLHDRQPESTVVRLRSRDRSRVLAELAFLAAHRGDRVEAERLAQAARSEDALGYSGKDAARLMKVLAAKPKPKPKPKPVLKSKKAAAKASIGAALRDAAEFGMLGLLGSAEHPWRDVALTPGPVPDARRALEQITSLCSEASYWPMLHSSTSGYALSIAAGGGVEVSGAERVAGLEKCIQRLSKRLMVGVGTEPIQVRVGAARSVYNPGLSGYAAPSRGFGIGTFAGGVDTVGGFLGSGSGAGGLGMSGGTVKGLSGLNSRGKGLAKPRKGGGKPPKPKKD